ncbi:MAG: efflux RND transporter periplasmic adaptor subunit [Coraliomargarita sp.]
MSQEQKQTALGIVAKTGLTVLILALIIGGLVGLYASNIFTMVAAGAAMGGPPPVSVATTDVSEMEWPVESTAIGSISALKGVILSVESPGIISELSFKSGKPVEAGTQLIQLDDRSERAELEAAQAAEELAKLSVDRSRQLLERKTISQAEFDAADAEYKQAVAQVANIEAMIEKKKLMAPFDGLLGIRRVNVGQYLNPGDEVVSLVSMDPINVTFFMPQKALGYLKKGLEVQISSDAFSGEVTTGELAAMEARVDQSTRMIEVQAKLPNPDGVLRVGMFVNVKIDLAPPRRVMAVPASSVLYASFGNSIYTVTPSEDGETYAANQKFVKLGERRGDFVEVLEGLEANERVVTDGAFKLYPGANVILQDERAPVAELEPTPKDS